MTEIEAAGIACADTEECPVQIIAEQFRGIKEDIADLLAHSRAQLERDQKFYDNTEARRDRAEARAEDNFERDQGE